MMKSIVEENLITFKELEQKIFAYVCEVAIEMTRILLEAYDRELHAGRDTKKYRDKGCRTTTIKTVYGDVTYARHVYQTTDEEGHRAFVYLLDESVKMDKMLEYIQMYADSVDTDDEKDTRSKKARELYQYLNNNKEGLMPYQKRGIRFPELPDGMKYGNMGVQENQNCTVITMRMKGNRKRWSVNGANNMAKLLYRKENKELAETVNRYTEALIFNISLREIITTLSAAKAPKKDGKGNPYIDVINMHVPMRDAMQTAARKVFTKAFL